MTRVLFMCGPAGSGKSTYAQALEAEGVVRLSFDEEAWRRGIRKQPLPHPLRDEIEQDLRDRLIELVRAGVDVVLDFSFWSRAMREEYRELLRPWGIEPETVYLATPRQVVLERVHLRTGANAGDVMLPAGFAQTYFDHFEPPTAEEGPLTVIE